MKANGGGQPAVGQVRIRWAVGEIPLRTASSCRRVRRRILLSARRPTRDENARAEFERERPTRELGSSLVGAAGYAGSPNLPLLAARWSHVGGEVLSCQTKQPYRPALETGGLLRTRARVLVQKALSCLLAIFLRRSAAMDRRPTAGGVLRCGECHTSQEARRRVDPLDCSHGSRSLAP